MPFYRLKTVTPSYAVNVNTNKAMHIRGAKHVGQWDYRD